MFTIFQIKFCLFNFFLYSFYVQSELLNETIPGLGVLNQSQKTAIRYAMGRQCSAIEAPPGTGKTTVASALTYLLLKQGVRRILVCAPSNIAADNLTLSLMKTGAFASTFKLVRMYARYIERDPERKPVSPTITRHALHHLVKGKQPGKRNNKKRIEDKTLQQAHVVCCTCISSGDIRLKGKEFDAVIIDECTQANDTEALVPICRAKSMVVIFGDRKQLGPIVKNKKNRKSKFTLSFFERMVFNHGHAYLNVQYRMHPAISEFPLATFYDNKVTNGVTAQQRNIAEDKECCIFPNSNLPIVFISSLQGANATRRDELGPNGISYVNDFECSIIQEVLTYLFRLNISPKQIEIIAMYEEQRCHLNKYLQIPDLPSNASSKETAKVEVRTVDGFQGRENDFVIISCVRSNKSNKIGFLSDQRRLNVALTRARCGLIIIGDHSTLQSNALFNKLITYYKGKGTFIGKW